MPVQGAVIGNLNEIVFNKGYMFATRQGGAADAIGFGALQDVALSHEFATSEIMGPESLAPLGVGITAEGLTGTYSCGVLHPEQLVALMGGSIVVNGANTDYTKLVEEQPLPFDLHFESGPSPLDDVDIVLYNCLCPTWSITFTDRAWAIQNGSFKVYGQNRSTYGSAAKLFVMSKPGNLTNSS
jgi:hypothetical protein